MFLFYLFACVPIAIGFFLWWKNKNIVWQEWLGGSLAALLFTAIFHMIAIRGMTGDVETWSGFITQTTHYGEWVEEYQQMHTRQVPSGTDSNGNTTYTTEIYFTTEHATHREKWTVDRDFGSYQDDEEITEGLYYQIQSRFGGGVDNTYSQSCTHGGHYDGGDRNAYVTVNKTRYELPVTSTHSFKNKVKAAPSVFSFIEVPTNVPVFSYPQNKNWMVSDRLLGRARNDVDLTLWDRMNSRLGPRKKVNVILIGFDTEDTMISEYQKAAWIGGKKNDLVLCYGKGWSRVFGWTDEELVKQNLQTILLTNTVNNSIIPLLEKEILTSYKIKDWSKFDYLSVEPRTNHYIWFAILMVITQSGLYIFFHMNPFIQGDNAGETVDARWRGYSGYRSRTTYPWPWTRRR